MAKAKKNKSPIPLGALILAPFLALGLSFFAIYHGMQNYITTSQYFRVRDVAVAGLTDQRYVDMVKTQITGENIFQVNVGELAQQIRQRFPHFTSVTATRVLPSRLEIVAIERTPVAVFRRGLWYVMVTEGMVLFSLGLNQPVGWPVIIGLEEKLPSPRVGSVYHMAALQEALLLAKALKKYSPDFSSALRPVPLAMAAFGRVSKIDVSDRQQMSFFLGDTLQIKVGEEDFEEKLNILVSILRSLGPDIFRVRYVDLRPQEPAIAMKDQKNGGKK